MSAPGAKPEQVSLEQLLAGSERSAPERPRRVQPWLRDPLLALGIAAAIYAVLRVFSVLMPYVVLVSAVLAVLLLRRVLAAVRVEEPPPAVRSPAWGVTDDEGGSSAQLDGVVRVVQRWEARFSWTERDHTRYASAVRPRLAELVEERLRQRHGVSLRTEPERARVLLGDPLWTFLNTRVRRGPTPREVAAIVAEMEKI